MTWLIFVHALAFILYWQTHPLYHGEVNTFLQNLAGFKLNYVLLFYGLTLLVGLWSLVRLALRQRAYLAGPAWLFGLFSALYLLFFYGSFIFLFIQDPIQLDRLGQLIDYFRIFPDTALLLALAWLVPRLLSRRLAPKKAGFAAAGLVFIFWLVPVVWTPGAVYRPPLAEKPRLVAHRGAAMLAPENTLAAAELAASLGAYALETDLAVSADGNLFLMHDSTLSRTTDISEVFPGRQGEPAANFTLAELSRLNAGGWFIARDPFRTVAHGLVSAAQVESYARQSIPTLAEVLPLVRQRYDGFIFDLREPPADHPYAGHALEACLAELAAAGVGPQTWMLVDEQHISQVRAALPEAALVAGVDARHPPSLAQLQAGGYRMVNSQYSLAHQNIHLYLQAGLWVNIWTVDEPWQYSRLWLLGVSSTTTNNVHTLAALSKPVFAMPFLLYLPSWIVLGLLGLGIALRANINLPVL